MSSSRTLQNYPFEDKRILSISVIWSSFCWSDDSKGWFSWNSPWFCIVIGRVGFWFGLFLPAGLFIFCSVLLWGLYKCVLIGLLLAILGWFIFLKFVFTNKRWILFCWLRYLLFFIVHIIQTIIISHLFIVFSTTIVHFQSLAGHYQRLMTLTDLWLILLAKHRIRWQICYLPSSWVTLTINIDFLE